MGDAGPLTSSPAHDACHSDNLATPSSRQALREINVLVTGFGAFKSFTTNPSYLITSSLPIQIDTSSLPVEWNWSSMRSPVATPCAPPYTINLHTHPTPVKVAYSPTSTAIPRMVEWTEVAAQIQSAPVVTSSSDHLRRHVNYDYVFHIGVAGGRDHYSLETNAHRDHYKIKDVDDRDGYLAGEYVWKREGLPEQLDVGWDKQETLARWEYLSGKAEDVYEEKQMAQKGYSRAQMLGSNTDRTDDNYRALSMIGKGKRAVVKLSNDAGRFLCEFILYTSLSTRLREADQLGSRTGDEKAVSIPEQSASGVSRDESPAQRVGKVAFLHVPGGVADFDIARGVRVAETAILALVSSWEDGYRNADVYKCT